VPAGENNSGATETRPVFRAAQLLSELTGLDEDMGYANLKLAIMAVACVFGCVAQFYPLPFPDSRALLAVCVVAYFALSAVLQYFTSFADRDVVWQSRRPAVSATLRCAAKSGAHIARRASGTTHRGAYRGCLCSCRLRCSTAARRCTCGA
jgi:hypothetical protein